MIFVHDVTRVDGQLSHASFISSGSGSCDSAIFGSSKRLVIDQRKGFAGKVTHATIPQKIILTFSTKQYIVIGKCLGFRDSHTIPENFELEQYLCPYQDLED